MNGFADTERFSWVQPGIVAVTNFTISVGLKKRLLLVVRSIGESDNIIPTAQDWRLVRFTLLSAGIDDEDKRNRSVDMHNPKVWMKIFDDTRTEDLLLIQDTDRKTLQEVLEAHPDSVPLRKLAIQAKILFNLDHTEKEKHGKLIT